MALEDAFQESLPDSATSPTSSEEKAEAKQPAQSSQAPAVNDTAENVAMLTAQLSNALGAIKTTVERIEEELLVKIKNNRTQQEAFDRLYEEMRQYKENFVRSAFKPVLLDLLLLYDNVVRTQRRLEGEERKAVEHLGEELLEVLYRRDVELIEEHPQVLDRRIQKVIQTVPTADPSEDRQVVAVVRDGFLWDGRVLRAQEVVIKRFQPTGRP